MDSTQGNTVGEMLRSAREARKLTIEQVNRETRISVQTLRSLEQDDFGAFPSETYLKGFLRSYAEFLGLDGAKLWSMIGQRAQAPAGASGGPAWDTEEALRVEKLGGAPILRGLMLPLLVVIVVVLAILLIRERRRPEGARMGSVAPVEAVRTAG
jgi:cytoskeletal protein RodZ